MRQYVPEAIVNNLAAGRTDNVADEKYSQFIAFQEKGKSRACRMVSSLEHPASSVKNGPVHFAVRARP
jgi:hypothetical protein